jgi:hypothetical protein
MVKPDMMGLSYHSWLDMTAVLFFALTTTVEGKLNKNSVIYLSIVNHTIYRTEPTGIGLSLTSADPLYRASWEALSKTLCP